jgi:hypothetical protein
MKAHEHYAHSVDFAEKAADNPEFGGALVGAILALAHAVQAGVMLQAMDEIQLPKDRAEWRDLWRAPAQPPKCG